MNKKGEAMSVKILWGVMVIGMMICSTTGAQEAKPSDTQVWQPVPPVIVPGENSQPPSDAIVLFDGEDVSRWQHKNGDAVKWEVRDGAMTVVKKTGAIITKQNFGDCQFHIEWRTPTIITGDGQKRGNSGVFFADRYEVQILDSYKNETYVNGQAVAIYKQHIPLVNASRPPGEWQSYDIIYLAPRFTGNGELESPAYMTVFHNGVLVHYHAELWGRTVNKGEPRYEAHPVEQPISIQDHGDPVSFRNIWIREMEW